VNRDEILRGLRLALLALGCVAALAPHAWAQKTDIVTLINGDKITCEIKLLDQGSLQVSTDDLGTVNIKWEKVVSVKGLRTFQVETSDGIRLLGQIDGGIAGKMTVTTMAGPIPFDLIEVVYIAPIGSSFWRRLDGSIDTGLSYTVSSGVAQFNFNTSVTHRRPTVTLSLTASSYVTRQAGAEDTSRETLQFSRSQLIGRRGLWFVQGGLERNEQLGFALRSTVTAGTGRYLVRSNRADVAVGGGLSANNEQPVDAAAVQNLEGFASIRQSFFTYDFPKTNVSFSADVYPGLSNWGRIRAELNGAIKREVIHDFTVGFTAYNSYDNRPPTADARTNDFGLSLTIGWTF
jgi:hypothetical protein